MNRVMMQPDIIDYMLLPGQIYVSQEPARISMVLGSCVAVCLWNSQHKIVAMSSYLYPFTMVEAEATAKYGNVALNCMMRLIATHVVKKNTCRHKSSEAPPSITLHASTSPRKTLPWPESFWRNMASRSYLKIPEGTWVAR